MSEAICLMKYSEYPFYTISFFVLYVLFIFTILFRFFLKKLNFNTTSLHGVTLLMHLPWYGYRIMKSNFQLFRLKPWVQIIVCVCVCERESGVGDVRLGFFGFSGRSVFCYKICCQQLRLFPLPLLWST